MSPGADRGWFDEPEAAEPETPADAPLAERMRPRSLDEFVGQDSLIGPGRWLRRVVESDGPLPR